MLTFQNHHIVLIYAFLSVSDTLSTLWLHSAEKNKDDIGTLVWLLSRKIGTFQLFCVIVVFYWTLRQCSDFITLFPVFILIFYHGPITCSWDIILSRKKDFQLSIKGFMIEMKQTLFWPFNSGSIPILWFLGNQNWQISPLNNPTLWVQIWITMHENFLRYWGPHP